MNNLEFSIIKYSYINNDLAWNVSLPFALSKDDKNPKAEWGAFPCNYVLIKHKDIGYILYDVGDYVGERTQFYEKYFPTDITREDCVDKQLEKIGLTVDDISAIIISHMHYDHANGLKYFQNTKAGQNIYVPKADFLAGCESVFCDTDPNSSSAYWKNTFEFKGLKFNLLEEDCELFDGVELYILSGHTAGVACLVLEVESGTYIFPSDTCGSMLNYGPPIKPPGILYDSIGFQKSMKFLKKLEKERRNAKIIFSHDRDQEKDLKFFPEFYK